MRKTFRGINFAQGIVKRTIPMSQEDIMYLIKDWEDNCSQKKPIPVENFISMFFREYFREWN